MIPIRNQSTMTSGDSSGELLKSPSWRSPFQPLISGHVNSPSQTCHTNFDPTLQCWGAMARTPGVYFCLIWMDFPLTNIHWLVVSTHLKNIGQNGNLPQIGVKIKNIWNHQFDLTWKAQLDTSMKTPAIFILPTRKQTPKKRIFWDPILAGFGSKAF